MVLFIGPLLPWIGRAVLVAVGVALAASVIDEINDHLRRGEESKARAKVHKVQRRGDAAFREFCAEHWHRMSPSTRRMFEEEM